MVKENAILRTPKNLIVGAIVAPLWIAAIASTTLAQTPLNQTGGTQPGCLQGYGDGTYKGERALTRNEFAAGLNACKMRVNRLLPKREHAATRADFKALIERQRALNAQLRQLSDRVRVMRVQTQKR